MFKSPWATIQHTSTVVVEWNKLLIMEIMSDSSMGVSTLLG